MNIRPGLVLGWSTRPVSLPEWPIHARSHFLFIPYTERYSSLLWAKWTIWYPRDHNTAPRVACLVSHHDFLTSALRTLTELTFRPVQDGGSHEIFFAVIIPSKRGLTQFLGVRQHIVQKSDSWVHAVLNQSNTSRTHQKTCSVKDWSID